MKKEMPARDESAKAVKVDGDCNDDKCPFHGSLSVRGRVFDGIVTKKFPNRIVLEFDRMIYVKKYERYKKSRTKIHARLPKCIEEKISVGDIVKVQECRPLSKTKHFVIVEKVGG